MTDNLRDRLIHEEGLKLFPYHDSKGIWTIGIGHNIEADSNMFPNLEELKKTGITKDYVFLLFDQDVQKASDDLLKYLPWTGSVDWPRKSVLIDLVFNMGIGVPGGKHGLLSMNQTLKHMEKGEWGEAAIHLRNTQWYKDVKSIRAEPLINIIMTGEM